MPNSQLQLGLSWRTSLASRLQMMMFSIFFWNGFGRRTAGVFIRDEFIDAPGAKRGRFGGSSPLFFDCVVMPVWTDSHQIRERGRLRCVASKAAVRERVTQ